MWGGDADSPSSFLDDPASSKLEVPLEQLDQIEDFIYYYGEFNSMILMETGLDRLIDEHLLDPRDIWVGYHKLEHLTCTNKKSKPLVVIHYTTLMDDPAADQVLLAYFAKHRWSTKHISPFKAVRRRACEALAQLVQHGNYKGRVLKERLHQDGVEEHSEEEDLILEDLKDPSQILRLEYWHGEELITNIDMLNQKIAQKKVRDTDVWVVYAPVGKNGCPTGKIDTTPWEGLVSDNAGHVLKAFLDELINSTKSRLVKKACEMVLHCLANENVCATRVAEHNAKYAQSD